LTNFWSPDTCECIANQDTQTLDEKCRTHNTWIETVNHNKSFSIPLDNTLFNSALRKKRREDQLTLPEQAEFDKWKQNQKDKATEKAKPQFQRR